MTYDKSNGIRPINIISKLPVSELSDEEICKLFFARFKASALVMMYEDEEGARHYFGRIRKRKGMFERYRGLLRFIKTSGAILLWNVRQLNP